MLSPHLPASAPGVAHPPLFLDLSRVPFSSCCSPILSSLSSPANVINMQIKSLIAIADEDVR